MFIITDSITKNSASSIKLEEAKASYGIFAEIGFDPSAN